MLFERIPGLLSSQNTKYKLRFQKRMLRVIWNFGRHSVFFFPQIHQMSVVDKIEIIESVIDVNYIKEWELGLKQKHVLKSVYSDLR